MLDQYKATPNDLLLDLHELLQVALTYSIAQTKCLPLQMNEIPRPYSGAHLIAFVHENFL